LTVEKYQFWSIRNVPVDEGLLLSVLLKIMNAKKTLELGVFTGCSLLTTALALPADGKQSIQIKKPTRLDCRSFKRPGWSIRLTSFFHSDAFSVLKDLIKNGKEEGSFDFAFVDADKENYINYHELLVRLVKVGGIIAYDNTLWFGSVAEPEETVAKPLRPGRNHVIKLNNFLAGDSRVELAFVSIGDGLTLCRRLASTETN
ncbi:hypothetical protein ABKV19_014382, partial [Rosa sericea]